MAASEGDIRPARAATVRHVITVFEYMGYSEFLEGLRTTNSNQPGL